MTTKITKIKLLSFVSYHDVVEQDIMWTLRMNEVKLEGRRSITHTGPSQLSRADGVFGDLMEDMCDFCNDNCKGIWTYTYTTEYKDDLERSSHFHGLTQMQMVGTMRVFFELREDRDMFMKNHILLAKLTQE